jgi:hypothetical protein
METNQFCSIKIYFYRFVPIPKKIFFNIFYYLINLIQSLINKSFFFFNYISNANQKLNLK